MKNRSAHCLVILAVLLVPATVGSVFAVADDKDLSKLLQKLTSTYDDWDVITKDPDPWIWEAALVAARQNAEPTAVVRTVAARIGISESAARPLVHGAVLRRLLKWEARTPEFQNQAASVELMLCDAVRRAPGHLLVYGELVDFYTDHAFYQLFPKRAQMLVELAEKSPTPGRVAVYLAGRMEYSNDRWGLIQIALRDHPENPAVFNAMMEYYSNPSDMNAALAEHALQLTEQLKEAPDVRVSVHLAGERLYSLLLLGLARDATQFFESLSKPVRDELLAGSKGLVTVDVNGLPFRVWLKDRRLSIAAMFAVEGHSAQAESILNGYEDELQKKAVNEGDGERDDYNVERRLLRRSLDSVLPREDLFDEIADYIESHQFGFTTWRRLFARFSERAGYGPLSLDALDQATSDIERFLSPRKYVRPEVIPEVVVHRADNIRGEAERLRQSLADDVKRLRSEQADAPMPADPLAATVARLLARPRMEAFVEHPLPEGITPLNLSEEESALRLQQRNAIPMPPKSKPIRIERVGTSIVAIVASQDYDPVGEVSSGAYWVVISRDDGKSWSKPLYTGLRINQPYRLRRFSDLPILSGSTLQIETDIWELDEDRIMFPPTNLRAKRQASGYFLSIPVAALERDSDGDGLTDLAEERLITDPFASDTDGDGIPDNIDPLPHVPQGGPADERAGVVAAALAHIGDYQSAAVISDGASATTSNDPLVGIERPSLSKQRTVFFMGNRSLFNSLVLPQRIIVLSPDEFQSARSKFGFFLPMQFTTILLDHSQRRAIVVWSASWRGGVLRLDKKDGKWEVTGGHGWIT